MKTLLALLCCCLPAQAALQFNGSSSVATNPLTSSAHFREDSRITIACWVKRYDTNTAGVLGVLFNSSQAYAWGITFDSSKTNCVSYRYANAADDSAQIFSSAPGLFSRTNVWTHLGFTYRVGTANSAVWYINGVAQAGSAWTSGTGTATFKVVDRALYIGADGNTTRFFNGQISEVCLFWNQYLDAVSMASLAGKVRGLPVQLQFHNNYSPNVLGTQNNFGLDGYWMLDESPGIAATSGVAIFNDRSGLFNLVSFSDGFARGTHTAMSPRNSPVSFPEQVCSYPPNE